jgi:hypothetical protein
MTRIAHCCCGSLKAETFADPAFIVACHCTGCQRRTGSAFGVSAYFKQDDVKTDGSSSTYVREGWQGRKLRYHFCPACGSTVYWFVELYTDLIGTAVGMFADPSFAKPSRSLWEATRHPWITFDCVPGTTGQS